jgi:hypothetical protein
MPFVKGQSGNPAGRPVGSRNRFTREMREALEEQGPGLIDRLAELAREANPAAMRLCYERLVPTGKHRAVAVELPSPSSPNYTMEAIEAVHRALGEGGITIDEASRLLGFIERTTRILLLQAAPAADLDERITRCEEVLTKYLILLGAAPKAEGNAETASAAPEPAVIANNNAETMRDTAASAAAQPAASVPIGKDNANGSADAPRVEPARRPDEPNAGPSAAVASGKGVAQRVPVAKAA